MIPREATPCDTLGEAILKARGGYITTGDPHTVIIAEGIGAPGGTFCSIPSAAYAKLREQGQHHGLNPLVTFRQGGLDSHRDSFRPLERALLHSERF